MQAIVCHQFAEIDQLQLEEFNNPTANDHDIVITIEASGVNFPDALMVQGRYQIKPPLPFIPGMEAAGTVSAVGSQVSHVKPGDRVVALTGTGAYAQQVACHESCAFIIPATISLSEAAALPVAYGTAHYALKQRAQLKAGETLLVLGAAGGTGLAAVQIGHAMGATVIAACSTDEKLATAKAHGASHTINYQQQDLKTELKKLTAGNGIDVVYDPVGGAAFDACTRCMAWNGRLLVIGFAAGKIPAFPTNLALVKGYSVVGVFWGEFSKREPVIYADNMRELFGWVANHSFKPVIDSELPLSAAVIALKKITQRAVQGKIILKP
jgi:NADPH2:quinone reductase